MGSRLRVGEVLEEAFRIFRLHFLKIAALALMILLPASALQWWILHYLQADALFSKIMEYLTEASDASAEEMTGLLQNNSGRLIPYFLLLLLVGLLSMVFTVALTKLTLDEGTHGALTPNRSDGEIVVVHENDGEIRQVGSASDYFAASIRVLPRYALTMLLCFVLVFLGILMFILPGILFAVVAEFVVYTVAVREIYGTNAIFDTLRTLFRNPGVFLYFLAANLVMQLAADGISGILFRIPMSPWVEFAATTLLEVVLQTVLSFFTIMLAVAFISRMEPLPEGNNEKKRHNQNSENNT